MISRLLFFAILVIIPSGTMIAQDGSDINYVQINDLDETYVGSTIHLDFFNRSFSFDFAQKTNRPIDEVRIEIDGVHIIFLEHRVDDGYNSWFFQQYLQSNSLIRGKFLRITEMDLLEVKKDSIKVSARLVFIDADGKVNKEEPLNKTFEFDKSIIVEVLVKSGH